MDDWIKLEIPEILFGTLKGIVSNYMDDKRIHCAYCGGENVHSGDCPLHDLYELIVNEEGVI